MNAIRNYLGVIPDGWITRPIECNGVHYGDFLMRGREIHVAVLPQHRRRGWSRRIARHALESLLAEHVFLITRSFKDDETEQFISRLGFVATNEDETFRYWWLNELPFERKNHVPR